MKVQLREYWQIGYDNEAQIVVVVKADVVPIRQVKAVHVTFLHHRQRCIDRQQLTGHSDRVQDDEESVPHPHKGVGHSARQQREKVEAVPDDLRDGPSRQPHDHRGTLLGVRDAPDDAPDQEDPGIHLEGRY